MKNSMLVGLAVGMVAGACLASKSQKTRRMVTDAEDCIKSKFSPKQDEFRDGESDGSEGGF